MAAQRVLVVGENPRERMGLSSILEDLGAEVTVAPGGAEAEFYVDRDDFEMVIADFATPHFSPIEFLKRIKLKAPDTELLFVSDTARVGDAVDAMKQGAMDFLIKPVDPELIVLCARRAFAGKKEPDPMGKGPEQAEPVAIVTQDPSMKRLLNLAARVADSTASVLIQGESGTGKELFARFIHERSNRRSMPFVAINCAALPETLLESELFGHEKGAFTGAMSRKPGKFELANRGTLFLDEITEMPFHLQAKLLRVVQEKIVDRVGGTSPVPVDVRVVSTTNRDIREAIDSKAFREDLYYRLNTIPLVIPPLRDRLGDLALLCDCFIRKYSILDARGVKSMTKDALEMLRQQPFAGNVRELENIIHRAVLLCDTDRIDVGDLLMDGEPLQDDTAEKNSGLPHDMALSPLREMEEKMIFHTLDKTEGNRTHAARILGISVRTLRNKLNEYKKNTAS